MLPGMLDLTKLTPTELAQLAEALRAIVQGPWIGQQEARARTGIAFEVASRLLEQWPVTQLTPDQAHVLRHAVLEVAYGIRVEPSDWDRWFSWDERHFELLLRTIDSMGDCGRQ